MKEVLEKVAIALRPGGDVYASFKVSEQDEIRDGWLFTNLTEPEIGKLIDEIGGFDVLSL